MYSIYSVSGVGNTRNMWVGFKTVTDYKRKTSSAEVIFASLPDELSIFYARFERNCPAEEYKKAQDPCPPVIFRADVSRSD